MFVQKFIISLRRTFREIERPAFLRRREYFYDIQKNIIPILPIAAFPQPVKETAKTCSRCSPMQRFSLLPASASTPQSSSSSRMWKPMSRTDTEMSGLQRPKLESPCMSVKASTMHGSMCFAKAVICSGNWLTASCVTTKVPISNLRGAIVSRA